MKENISFTVTPYALFDTIKALQICGQHKTVVVHVTMEDGNLVINASRHIEGIKDNKTELVK